MFSLVYGVFCFFKQKTAYEVRISDWSSDVCSSDLEAETLAGAHQLGGDDEHPAEREAGAQAGQVARQRGRHQDAPHQVEAGEAADARDLDQLAVGAEDAGDEVQVDREEHADRKSTRLNSSH